MVTAVTLALALAFEPTEARVMRRPPRDPHEPLLTGFMLWRIGFVSVLLVIAPLGLFLWETGRGATLEEARTVAVNALVVGEIFYLFNSRYLHQSSLSREGLLGSRPVLVTSAILLALQLALTYWPPLQQLMGAAPIGVADWGLFALAGFTVFLLVELEKAVWRQLRR
jgi:magnesium-transporting ATPase (P-type)